MADVEDDVNEACQPVSLHSNTHATQLLRSGRHCIATVHVKEK